MVDQFFRSYKIDDPSYVSFIKREIHNLLTLAGFSVTRTGEIDIIVSELTSNLIKHADGGELLYRLTAHDTNKCFEIYSIDSGPGTNDIQRYLKDGVSSVNTLGHGLGAISRLSDLFQIYSAKDWGTVAYAKAYMRPLSTKLTDIRHDVTCFMLQVCMPGENVCGDGCWIKRTGDQTQIFVGDGLGHGRHANEAVNEGIKAFIECKETEPSAILRHIHSQTKKTRGLVASVAVLNKRNKEWKMCGIGNINTRLYEGIVSKTYMCNNGIVGHNIPNTINDYSTKAERYQNIIMCSDGIKTRYDLAKYPMLLKYDSAIIAGVIFKDSARRTDDMTVLVGKTNV